MGIRECALQNKAFAQLKQIYDHRPEAIDRLSKTGKKIIGELGYDVPDEVVIALGMIPVRLFSDEDCLLKEADQYLEYAFDPMMRAKFEKIVDGTCAGQMDALAISNSTDVIIRIFMYLRELKRVEPKKRLPEFTFIDWLFTRNRMYQERNERIVRQFITQAESWAGQKLTGKALLAAAQLCNNNRLALRKISDLRHGKDVRISGCEALVIIGSAFFMEREQHTQLILQIAKAAKHWPAIAGTRVYYTGSVQENIKVYERIEALGNIIVGEDHDWGERFYNRDFNTSISMERAIADCYMLREFSSKKAFVSQRVAALDREAAAAGAEAVIFYNHIFEEAASWDYPEQKKSLESKGIRTVCYSKMPWPPADSQTIIV